MKIKADVHKLRTYLKLMEKGLPSPTVNSPSEDLLGLQAADGYLIAYGFAKGQHVRSVFPIDVEEEGFTVVNRTLWFRLLNKLSGEILIQPSTNTKTPNRIEIKRLRASGNFTLNTYDSIPPRVPTPSNGETKIDTADVHKLLKFCTLDGELMGGGYKLERNAGWLTVTVADRIRLIYAKTQSKGEPFRIIVPPQAMSGIFETFKHFTNVTITPSSNSILLKAQDEKEQHEFGFLAVNGAFPDLSKIMSGAVHPYNTAQFEVPDLREAVEQSFVLADNELAATDFTFDGEFCKLSTITDSTSAEVHLNAPAEIENSEAEQLRLRLDFVLTFLKKAEESGSPFINVRWGEKAPVTWTPDFDQPQDIDFMLICAALNRNTTV